MLLNITNIQWPEAQKDFYYRGKHLFLLYQIIQSLLIIKIGFYK